MKKKFSCLLCYTAGLALVGYACFSLATTFNLSINPTPAFNLPQFAAADLNGNTILENYDLTNGRLTIIESGKIIYQSPNVWRIDKFALADANHDGKTEICFSVWKRGSFGSSHPFWITKDDPSIKNHFFVFGWKGNKVKPVWQSSNLSRPNLDFKFCDINGDGQQELLAWEGNYHHRHDRQLSVWKWQSWGFYKLD
jgi:hypothetical protein